MITVYSPNALDFTTLGEGALVPSSAVVDEQARGMFELTVTQPVTDDLRDALITQHAILKAPAPVRESPQAEAVPGSVTRSIYKSNRATKLYAASDLRRAVSSIVRYTECAVLSSVGNTYEVLTLNGGARGWVNSNHFTFAENRTEIISGDTPGSVIRPVQSREQLFRIYSITRDSSTRRVSAQARHITYDLAGYLISGTYAPENVEAATAVQTLLSKCDRTVEGFTIHCNVTGKISGDYTGKSLLNALLDPDTGIAAQTNARVVRDNFDLWLLPDTERDRGVCIMYGKNLKSASLVTDAGDIVTHIQPEGKKSNGDPLIGDIVASPNAADIPVRHTARVQYDVKVGEDGISSETAAKAKLQELALNDFENGADSEQVKLDADFVRLELCEEYRELADSYSLHLYDTVPVMDATAQISASVRMSGYTYNCLLEKYESTTLGDIEESTQTVYGYEIKDGTLSGGKLQTGSLPGDRLRELSVGYAKITAAAISQLKADAIDAVHANIQEIAAGTITAEQLVADLATIAAMKVETLNAGSITTDRLAAALAAFTVVTAGAASFDEATIRHLIASALQVEDAVGDKVFIKNLAVDYASIVSASVGSLVIKASDGLYYKLDVDASGNVSAVRQNVTDDEAEAGRTDAGQTIIETSITASDLSASNLKAVYALINRLDAARIDVDELTARSAFIEYLRTANLSANESLRIALEAVSDIAEGADGKANDILRYMDFTEAGLSQHVPGHIYYTLIDEDGFDVRSTNRVEPIATMNASEGVKASQFTAGRITVKGTTTGGWVWQEAPSQA